MNWWVIGFENGGQNKMINNIKLLIIILCFIFKNSDITFFDKTLLFAKINLLLKLLILFIMYRIVNLIFKVTSQIKEIFFNNREKININQRKHKL